jgi:hypothetical protein
MGFILIPIWGGITFSYNYIKKDYVDKPKASVIMGKK